MSDLMQIPVEEVKKGDIFELLGDKYVAKEDSFRSQVHKDVVVLRFNLPGYKRSTAYFTHSFPEGTMILIDRPRPVEVRLEVKDVEMLIDALQAGGRFVQHAQHARALGNALDQVRMQVAEQEVFDLNTVHIRGDNGPFPRIPKADFITYKQLESNSIRTYKVRGFEALVFGDIIESREDEKLVKLMENPKAGCSFSQCTCMQVRVAVLDEYGSVVEERVEIGMRGRLAKLVTKPDFKPKPLVFDMITPRIENVQRGDIITFQNFVMGDSLWEKGYQVTDIPRKVQRISSQYQVCVVRLDHEGNVTGDEFYMNLNRNITNYQIWRLKK